MTAAKVEHFDRLCAIVHVARELENLPAEAQVVRLDWEYFGHGRGYQWRATIGAAMALGASVDEVLATLETRLRERCERAARACRRGGT